MFAPAHSALWDKYKNCTGRKRNQTLLTIKKKSVKQLIIMRNCVKELHNNPVILIK